MARCILFAGVAIAVVGACTLPSSDEFAKPSTDAGSAADASPDASPSTTEGGALPEAGASSDGGGDAGGPPPGIVDLLQAVDSNYDNGKCGQDTGTFQADATSSNVAHSGPNACQFCRNTTNSGTAFTMDIQIHVHPKAGQQYMASAFVRLPPGETDQGKASISLRTHNGDFVAVNQAESTRVTLTSDYQFITVTVDVTENTSDMDMFVTDHPPDGDKGPCFLLDDVYVWQSK